VLSNTNGGDEMMTGAKANAWGSTPSLAIGYG
jgi:hypothetical protein